MQKDKNVIRAHKSLANRAVEVGPLEKREVQFVVERECSNNPLRQIESEFFARHAEFQKATGKTLTRNTCFCEHMGRVIE
jgi:hypothetical protein